VESANRYVFADRGRRNRLKVAQSRTARKAKLIFSPFEGILAAMDSESPSPNRRQLQARETRERIYEAAWQLIGEEGYEEVSVERICARAGIAKGSFYHHFRNKADLIVEGYSICDRYFEDEVSGRLKAAEGRERLVEFAVFQARYASELGVDLIRQVYKAQIENATRFFISPERGLPSVLRRIVAEEQAKGLLASDVSAEYVTEFVLRFTRGLIYDWCLRNGDYDLPAAMEEASRRLLSVFSGPGKPSD